MMRLSDSFALLSWQLAKQNAKQDSKRALRCAVKGSPVGLKHAQAHLAGKSTNVFL